jgi:TetR/AcrR family transcriptional repressor of nem operon
MRRSRDQKAETHEALLERASHLFRENGIEATSVAEVMAEAGLTHGGFYRHFANKDALVAETIRQTFASFLHEIDRQSHSRGVKQAVDDYLSFYLSEAHMRHPSQGCPIPTLAAEIARSSDELKDEFSQNVNQMIQVLARGFDGPDHDAERHAIRALALRAGAILIARACDTEAAKTIMEACRE